MNMVPYESVNGLAFDETPVKADMLFGQCRFEKRNNAGELEKHYKGIVVRFSADEGLFCECTVYDGVDIEINGEPFVWSRDALLELCRKDGGALESCGIIVLFDAGVTLTGLEEGERLNRSLTFFRRGHWDDLRAKMRPVVLLLRGAQNRPLGGA